MNYDEFKELCRRSWEEEYKYLCIGRYKKIDQEDIVFVLKAKPCIQNALQKQNSLIKVNVIFK